MNLASVALPDGRTISCVNAYEVEFSVHEIFSSDLTDHGINLPADGTYFDVGANIGLFALFLEAQCPQASIFAYEPMTEAFAALDRNLRDFVPAAHAFPIAMGAAPGVAEFDYFPGVTSLSNCNPQVGNKLAGGIRSMLTAQRDTPVGDILDRTGANELSQDPGFVDHLLRAEKVHARVETLSREISAHQVNQIDLLKIDTEGAEKDVLAGIAAEDWPKIRQLMVEVHLGRQETENIASDLERRGFRTSIGDHPLAQYGAPVFHVYAMRRGAPHE
jgi:FkbM family methyltransferase